MAFSERHRDLCMPYRWRTLPNEDPLLSYSYYNRRKCIIIRIRRIIIYMCFPARATFQRSPKKKKKGDSVVALFCRVFSSMYACMYSFSTQSSGTFPPSLYNRPPRTNSMTIMFPTTLLHWTGRSDLDFHKHLWRTQSSLHGSPDRLVFRVNPGRPHSIHGLKVSRNIFQPDISCQKLLFIGTRSLK